MKILSVLVAFLCVTSLLLGTAEASPVKIPINAIKKGAKVVGHGIRALNIAGKAHDIIGAFKHKKNKHKKRKH